MSGSRLLLWSSLVTLVLGCGTEPDDKTVYGTYALVAVEGSPVPYLDPTDPDCDVYITQGELRLLFTGTYDLQFSGPYQCTGGQNGTLGRLYSGPFTTTGSTLAFTAEIQGFGPLQFSGTAGLGTVEVTVPPIPPTTGPDLTLGFQINP